MLFAYSTGRCLVYPLSCARITKCFVLRQGILRQHVLPIVLFCAVTDTILIICGCSATSSIADFWSKLVHAIWWSGSLAFRVWCAACSRPI